MSFTNPDSEKDANHPTKETTNVKAYKSVKEMLEKTSRIPMWKKKTILQGSVLRDPTIKK
jgi:hypothetical protein